MNWKHQEKNDKKNKKEGQKIILRQFIPSPTKQGKGLNLTKKLYINNKHFLDEGELEKNNLVMKSNIILLTIQKNLIKKNIIN